jgi:hypothetical protein
MFSRRSGSAHRGERSLALERLAESEARLRWALEHLDEVQESERRGLAIDLHDDALPALSAVGLRLALARERCDDEDVREHLSQSGADLRAARIRLRYLMLDLIPGALEREGLGNALRHRLDPMKLLNGTEHELHDRVGRQPSAGGGRRALPDRAGGIAQRHLWSRSRSALARPPRSRGPRPAGRGSAFRACSDGDPHRRPLADLRQGGAAVGRLGNQRQLGPSADRVGQALTAKAGGPPRRGPESALLALNCVYRLEGRRASSDRTIYRRWQACVETPPARQFHRAADRGASRHVLLLESPQTR